MPVEFVVYPDEGHGFARPENNLDWEARVWKVSWPGTSVVEWNRSRQSKAHRRMCGSDHADTGGMQNRAESKPLLQHHYPPAQHRLRPIASDHHPPKVNAR
jgi:hypothetical protein